MQYFTKTLKEELKFSFIQNQNQKVYLIINDTFVIREKMTNLNMLVKVCVTQTVSDTSSPVKL